MVTYTVLVKKIYKAESALSMNALTGGRATSHSINESAPICNVFWGKFGNWGKLRVMFSYIEFVELF